MRKLATRAGIIFALTISAGIASAQNFARLNQSVLEALNQLRADPASYVATLKQRREYFRGKVVEFPGQPNLFTREGVRPVDEAIRALRSLPAAPGEVTLAHGLSLAASDHVRDSGPLGSVGHVGRDGSSFEQRVLRYGTWTGEIGENISYGPEGGRDVIADLLIDDGVADRGHRKSLLNPIWHHVGIACGPHARYGTMCVIDFAVRYRPR